jgi:hypothetical protein
MVIKGLFLKLVARAIYPVNQLRSFVSCYLFNDILKIRLLVHKFALVRLEQFLLAALGKLAICSKGEESLLGNIRKG